MADRSLIPAQRRRAQNRASQRAFRERKERHVKNLEQQLEELHHQYEELLIAYKQQKWVLSNLKSELQDVRSEISPLQVPQNSPLELPATSHAQSFQRDIESSQFHQNNRLLIPHSQSLTPASTFETQFSSRTSISEESTPFGALLPITPSENFEQTVMFQTSDLYFPLREGSQCYSAGEGPESQPHQQQDGISSSGLSKEFAVNPSTDLFEGWR